MGDFIFRDATLKDVSFLISTIIEAEKSGTNTLSYSTVFGLSEDLARKYIEAMLLEEVDGCELSVSSFLVAEMDGVIAGAVAAWIEGADGVPSLVLKGNLLNRILPQVCIERAFGINRLLEELHIENRDNSIQLGLVYVAPAFRGFNLAKKLIDFRVNELLKTGTGSNEVYVQVFGNNISAIKAYEKADFRIELIKETNNEEVINFLPSKSKVLMKRII